MKENLTPYEILYRILSNKNYPLTICGYQIIYDKLTMDCDIILKEEDIVGDKSVYHIEKKISIMKKVIQELQEQKIIIPTEYIPIKPIECNCVGNLFGGNYVEKR